MLNSETKRIIDSARDILVGKLPAPNTQVEQITLAMLYKFMDDIDQESLELGGVVNYFVGDFEKYSWREIMKKSVSSQNRILKHLKNSIFIRHFHARLRRYSKTQLFRIVTLKY